MELCDGAALADILSTIKSFPERDIAYCTRESLKGLAYLHGTQKIHRDMKCGNILATRQGTIKLADFGVSARITDSIKKRYFQTICNTFCMLYLDNLVKSCFFYKV